MQLLVDTTQENPTTLMFIANTLVNLVNMTLEDGEAPYHITPVKLLADKPAPSINGPQIPIVLHAHAPAAPIDAQPLTAPVNDPAQMNPEVLFNRAGLFAGVIHQNIVPAGTPEGFSQPGTTAAGTQTAVMASAPPAPGMIQPNASHVTTTAAVTGNPAPLVGNVSSGGVAANPPAAAVPVPTDRDSDGLPWDARIHSDTRKTNADGTWRYRRNLDPAVKAAITAELKTQYGGQASFAPPAVLGAAYAGAIPAAPPFVALSSVGVTHSAPEAPPAPTVTLQPGAGLPQPSAAVPLPPGLPVGVPDAPQPPVVPALGFRDFMSAVNKALAAGRLAQEQLTNACKAVNLDGITALASEPGKISLVHSQIAHLLGAATA